MKRRWLCYLIFAWILGATAAQSADLPPPSPRPLEPARPIFVGGDPVWIARSAKGLNQQIEYDYRICGGYVAGPLGAPAATMLKVTYNQESDAPIKQVTLKPGECVNLSRPRSIMLNDGYGCHDARSRCTYARFRGGSLKNIDANYQAPPDATAPIPESSHATQLCADLPKAPHVTFARWCEMVFPRAGNYRVCVGKSPFDVTIGRKDEWPPYAVQLIVEPALFGKDYDSNNHSGPSGNHWSEIVAPNCYDVFDVGYNGPSHAFVMVGPAQPDVKWEAGHLKHILYSYSRLAP